MPISNGREAVAARHPRELAEFLASSPRPSPQLRGLSLQPGSLGNDCCESSGDSGSDERSGLRSPQPPQRCGDCPRDGGAE
ncbi:MAG UNVERIFIED_CONTAM: hypothetical protein LVR18_01705 [Planctomycetaceae bacterium]